MCILGKASAQDATFSQYYSSSLYLNPSFAGVEQDITFSSNYRSQWQSIIQPYVTNQLSFIYPIYVDEIKQTHIGGIGGSIYTDRAGEGNFKTLGANVNAGYKIPIESELHSFFVGTQLGIIQKSLDLSQLQWGDQYNPFIGFDAAKIPTEDNIITSHAYFDMGLGAIYYYNQNMANEDKKLSGFFGVSTYHLNQPNESLIEDDKSKLPILYKGHGGINIPFATRFIVSPNILIASQNSDYHLNGGLYLTYLLYQEHPSAILKGSEITLGGWYRNQDAFIMSAGVTHKAYTLGFSYDWNTSTLRYATKGRGAYEISLTLRKLKNRSPKHIATPRI